MFRKIGASYTKESARFVVWAPEAQQVQVNLLDPVYENFALQKEDEGYWAIEIADLPVGTRYFYQLNQEVPVPDPASLSQPEGVHGPSEVVDREAFAWTDQTWKGLPLRDMIMYELHIGTFTPEGTFEGIRSKIPYLLELGINAIELMPVAQFPGSRNWGYDGVFPFAVHHAYGGAEGLKALVNACHEAGIAVVLDVVYNHMGPEGNYLSAYGPYFTSRYCTPWGDALNFDDAHCDGVRNFFIQNALMWFRDFHIDALRLDAVHAIKDHSAQHFLLELSEAVKACGKELNRELVLIGECDLNDPRYIDPVEKGGFGLDGQWSDEFHHALHTLVTGETNGYYSDFGSLEHLQTAFQDSFVYTGQYSSHRKKRFGKALQDNPYSQLVVFAQNHDHIGNRMLGDRLAQSVSFEELKLVAGTYLLSPYVPLLFMGEEYGEDQPFAYFVSHTDEALVEAVRQGRQQEFSHFFQGQAEVPDPQAESTFWQCKLNWDFADNPKKMRLLDFYKQLIAFRKASPAFQIHQRGSLEVQAHEATGIIAWQKCHPESGQPLLYAVFNFGSEEAEWMVQTQEAGWQKVLDSAEETWLGPGSQSPFSIFPAETLHIGSRSFLLYENRQAEGGKVDFTLYPANNTFN
jgi:maltooligosyltrehalose trehalohydrolase